MMSMTAIPTQWKWQACSKYYKIVVIITLHYWYATVFEFCALLLATSLQHPLCCGHKTATLCFFSKGCWSSICLAYLTSVPTFVGSSKTQKKSCACGGRNSELSILSAETIMVWILKTKTLQFSDQSKWFRCICVLMKMWEKR